jgi:hypothetical protein
LRSCCTSLAFEGGGDLRMVDPRRLGGVQLDPDTEHLGTDALAMRLPAFRTALASDSGGPVVDDKGKLVGIASAFRTKVNASGAVVGFTMYVATDKLETADNFSPAPEVVTAAGA